MLSEVGKPVLSHKYLSFTEKHQGAWNPPPYLFLKPEGPMLPSSILKFTLFQEQKPESIAGEGSRGC